MQALSFAVMRDRFSKQHANKTTRQRICASADKGLLGLHCPTTSLFCSAS